LFYETRKRKDQFILEFVSDYYYNINRYELTKQAGFSMCLSYMKGVGKFEESKD